MKGSAVAPGLISALAGAQSLEEGLARSLKLLLQLTRARAAGLVFFSPRGAPPSLLPGPPGAPAPREIPRARPSRLEGPRPARPAPSPHRPRDPACGPAPAPRPAGAPRSHQSGAAPGVSPRIRELSGAGLAPAPAHASTLGDERHHRAARVHRSPRGR